MAHVAAESTARALQYGPDRGHGRDVRLHRRGDGGRGHDVDPAEVIVTTGGQQVIDLVCKTLIDPGDVIVAEAPTYPGAVPTFSAYQADVEQIEIDADGMPIDALEAHARPPRRREGRRPKFIYTIPNFQNPGGVTMSLARRRRLVEVARERELLVLEDNPYGLLRYEGEPLPTLYSLDAPGRRARRRVGPRDLPGHVLEDPLPGPAPRLGGRAAAGAREAEPRQTGRRPVLLAGHADVRRGLLREREPTASRLARLRRALRDLYRRRRDAMLDALAEHFGEQARWTHPAGRAVHLGDARRAHRHDRPARARARDENVAFVPGRAAYVDGRSGARRCG